MNARELIAIEDLEIRRGSFTLHVDSWNLKTGEVVGFFDSDGDSIAHLLLPAVVVVPMLAGFLVAASIGKKLELALSGFSLLLGFHTVFIVRSMLEQLYGREASITIYATIGYLAALTLIASVPPIWFLRRAT